MAGSIEGLSGLQRRFAAIASGNGNRKLMGQLGLLAVAEQKRLVRRRTGNTARSITISGVSETSVTTSVNKVGRFLEYGTRAHVIRPKNARALRWATGKGVRLSGTPRKGADVVFATRVNHPGTKPYPFMVPGAKLALQKAGLAKFVIDEWNAAD